MSPAPQWVSSQWVPTPQGGLWVQHFRTEQDETGKSSSRQTFPTNKFCAGHGVFGRKGLDKGPSCYAKCWVLAQLLAPVPLTLLSHCPAKATHATVKKHKKKTLGCSKKRIAGMDAPAWRAVSLLCRLHRAHRPPNLLPAWSASTTSWEF